MATQTAPQGIGRNTGLLGDDVGNRLEDRIHMTVGAARQILRAFFGHLRRIKAVDAGVEFRIDVAVGEFLVRGGFLDVAFGGAVHLLRIRMRNHIQIQMAVPAQDFPVHRIAVLAFTHIK